MGDNEKTREMLPHIVLASFDEAGRETFITKNDFLLQEFGDLAGRAWLWELNGTPSIPSNVGGFPTSLALPGTGSVKFAMVWVAPETVGKQDYTTGELSKATDFKVAEDPELHITDTGSSILNGQL